MNTYELVTELLEAGAMRVRGGLDIAGGASVKGAIDVEGDLTAASLTTSGNLTFTGPSARLYADFTSGVATRTMIQTSVTNGLTAVSAVPNGTAKIATFRSYGSSNLTNAPFLDSWCDDTGGRLEVGREGSGAYLPLTLRAAGTERARFDTTAANLAGPVNLRLSAGASYNGSVWTRYDPAYGISHIDMNRDGQINFHNAPAGAGSPAWATRMSIATDGTVGIAGALSAGSISSGGLIQGTQLNASGGPLYTIYNTARLTSGGWQDAHIRMDQQTPAEVRIGFHESGSTALSLYKVQGAEALRIRGNGGSDWGIAMTDNGFKNGMLSFHHGTGHAAYYSSGLQWWSLTTTGDDYNALYCGPSGLIVTNYNNTARIMYLNNAGTFNINAMGVQGYVPITATGHYFGMPNVANGTGQAIAQAWHTYSSASNKQNVRPIPDPLRVILDPRLHGVAYDHVSDPPPQRPPHPPHPNPDPGQGPSPHAEEAAPLAGPPPPEPVPSIGLVAEEWVQVMPEVVALDATGNAVGVDYGRVSALLFEAVKELAKRVAELERPSAPVT